MYAVYKITNKINNKIYIGSTNDIARRWREHKSHAFNPNCNDYNYPLQRAIRKYGLDNFLFEIIQDNFLTRYDAEEFEAKMINYYKSNQHEGYNQTNITHNGLTDENVRSKLRKKIIAINIENPDEKIIFNSITEAANTFNTERKSITSCAKGNKRYSNVKGYIFRFYQDGEIQEIEDCLITDVINKYNNENPVINEQRHNITEWCNIYDISRQAVYKRVKKGMNIVDAITMPKRG